MARPLIFRSAWRLVQLVLAVSLLFALYGAAREYSLRTYLRGFSDAVVPLTAGPEQKVEAILVWMCTGPARRPNLPDDFMANRDPQDTLNYGQLLKVCGTATNAFLNLAASSGLSARRLLLIGPDRGAKHVVAEVRLDGRWVVVDPTLRILFRDAAGHTVTRTQLREPAMLREVTRNLPGYPPDYTYEKTSHVHLTRLPLVGGFLRKSLDAFFPSWEERLNWTLLLERKWFALALLSLASAFICLLAQFLMRSYARKRLGIEPLSLMGHLRRMGKAVFSGTSS